MHSNEVVLWSFLGIITKVTSLDTLQGKLDEINPETFQHLERLSLRVIMCTNISLMWLCTQEDTQQRKIHKCTELYT